MMNFGKKFAVGVASAALVASLGGLVAPVAVATPSNAGFIAELGRLAGADRVATSLAVAAHEWGKRGTPKGDKYKNETQLRDTAKRVYLASAEDAHMVDAATAGMLKDGPIVYVTNNIYVGTAVGNYLADTVTNPGFKTIEEVVPIGGEAAIAKSVAQSVADQIKKKSNKKAKVVDALAGKDRYGTSVSIAQYMYNVSQNSEHDSYKWYGHHAVYTTSAGDTVYGGGISNPHDGSLHMAYFANGADSHIVDSMVAGTLDNGPILLVEPDGKIPEVVAEFIKKTLPVSFGALGGTAAVPDATVNEAWVIKALANKWDSSYSVPGVNMSVRELERLVYGKEGGNKDVTSDDYKGLKRHIKDDSKPVLAAWDNQVAKIRNEIDAIFIKHNGKLPGDIASVGAAETDMDKVIGLLKSLYGKGVIDGVVENMAKAEFLKKNDTTPVTYSGVDWEKIEDSGVYADAIKASRNDLISMWKGQKQDLKMGETLTELGAQLSQILPTDTWNGKTALEHTTVADGSVPLNVVRDLAKLTVKTQEDWFELAKKQLAQAKGMLRGELDKIDAKTVLRLGGKDRFETAQLIANQWAKMYGAEYTNRVDGSIGIDGKFFETYVANGHRLPDSLTAGQLTRGPIMLVRGSEKNTKELSEFTAKVATHLQCWSDKKHTLNLFGVGGKAVLADSALQAVVDLANTGSVCAPKKKERVEVNVYKDLTVTKDETSTAGVYGTTAGEYKYTVKDKDGSPVDGTKGVTFRYQYRAKNTDQWREDTHASLKLKGEASLDATGNLKVETVRNDTVAQNTPAGEYRVIVTKETTNGKFISGVAEFTVAKAEYTKAQMNTADTTLTIPGNGTNDIKSTHAIEVKGIGNPVDSITLGAAPGAGVELVDAKVYKKADNTEVAGIKKVELLSGGDANKLKIEKEAATAQLAETEVYVKVKVKDTANYKETELKLEFKLAITRA